jgi:AbrB family looped-hinge helix DNA binding protein
METAMLTTKGQLVIPKNIRKKYEFIPGTRVVFEETEHGVIIRPMDKDYIEHLISKVEKGFPTTKEYLKWKSEEKKLEEPIVKYRSRNAKRRR